MRASSHIFAAILRRNKILDFAGPSIRSAIALEYDLGRRGRLNPSPDGADRDASSAGARWRPDANRVIGFVSQKISGIAD
jgi:hypothetical protein